MSWHNPDISNLLDFRNDTIAGLTNAYGAAIRDSYTYASDSNGYWRFKPLGDVIGAGHDRLHLLTHPEWWTPTPLSPSARIDRCITGRAAATRRDYDALLAKAGRHNVGRDHAFPPAGAAPLVLTGLLEQDRRPMFAWINDPATVRYNAAFKPVTWEEHCAWFDTAEARADRRLFVFRRSATAPAIGVIQLIDIHSTHRSAELVVRIGEAEQRGSGLGSAALRLVLDQAFGDLGLERVWLRVFSNNGRAIGAYEKVGFHREGLMRRSALIEEEWLDQWVMGVLRQDYLSMANDH